MTKYNAAAMATLAAQLRAGARRPDPQVVSVSRAREIGEQSLKLAQALGSDASRRQAAMPTRAEAAEIDRVIREQAEWFDGAVEDEHPR